VVDTKWNRDKSYPAFEILKEEPGEGPRVFSVKLVLQKAGSGTKVRYVVPANRRCGLREETSEDSGMGILIVVNNRRRALVPCFRARRRFEHEKVVGPRKHGNQRAPPVLHDLNPHAGRLLESSSR